MANQILFVFEGEKVEKEIYESLKQHFLQDVRDTIIVCAYCSHIYAFSNNVSDDEYLDVFTLLKENPKNAHLNSYMSSQFSEIYMFFDYDGHTPRSTLEQLQSIISTFDNETENGKIFISYPMVEALMHPAGCTDFKDETVVSSKTYKQVVKGMCRKGHNEYTQFDSYSAEQWNFVTDAHVKKLNFIMEDEYKWPEWGFSQADLLIKQNEKYIPNGKVSVLSAFPTFLIDYYGSDGLKEQIS